MIFLLFLLLSQRNECHQRPSPTKKQYIKDKEKDTFIIRSTFRIRSSQPPPLPYRIAHHPWIFEYVSQHYLNYVADRAEAFDFTPR
jgi:hypothetical protein